MPGRNGYIWLLRFICGSTARRLYHFAFQKAKRWFIVGCFGMHQVLVRLEPPKRALKYIYIRKRDSQSKSQRKISLTFSLEIQLHWLSSASSSLSFLILVVMDQFCCLFFRYFMLFLLSLALTHRRLRNRGYFFISGSPTVTPAALLLPWVLINF